MLKTYQDLDDFLSNEIEKLDYEQAKSLIEFYIQDFIAKISSEFYQNELPEEQRYFKQLYELVKINITKWDWQKIQQVIDDLNHNAEQMEDEYSDDLGLFGSDLFELITTYRDFLNSKQNSHWLAIDILMRYFGSLHELLNIDFDDDEWATNPQIKPYIEKLKNQIKKGIA